MQIIKYMQVIKYNEFTIIATAFKDDNEKWIGQAELQSAKNNPIAIQNPLVFDNETFDSAEEAENFALDSAEFFIDSQVKDAGSE